MNEFECRSPRRDAVHVLNCEACRADARAAAAWESLAKQIRPDPQQEARDASPSLVGRFVFAVRQDRARRTRTRWALAAAAALFFFFCVGTGHETAQPQGSPEETYAALVSPGELSGLVPPN